MTEWQRGYDDGFNGVEPSPLDDDMAWADYMRGYKSGKRKAAW